WLAAPWLPPAAPEVDAQRAALEAVAVTFALEAIWLIKVETGIDGVAWMELTAAETPSEEAEDAPSEGGAEVGDAIFAEQAEVLYAAPDAPPSPEESPDEDVEAAAADEDDDTGTELEVESHWRNSVPPLEHAVPFPIERYPDVIEDYDWERFGIALK